MAKYCCEVMDEQLTYECDVHGKDCPDVIVTICTSQFHEGALMLWGRNAEYACNYCPWCGTKWEGP